jgi:hypothetical protein
LWKRNSLLHGKKSYLEICRLRYPIDFMSSVNFLWLMLGKGQAVLSESSRSLRRMFATVGTCLCCW